MHISYLSKEYIQNISKNIHRDKQDFELVKVMHNITLCFRDIKVSTLPRCMTEKQCAADFREMLYKCKQFQI